MHVMETHYSLNIALNGQHYARVTVATGFNESEATTKAEFIAKAMKQAMPSARWSFSLTHWQGSGKAVAFEGQSL